MKEIKKSDTKKRKLRIRNNGIVLTAFSAGILCLAAIAAIMYQNITSSHTEKHQDSDSAISVDTDAQTDLLSDNNTTIFPDTDETENKTLDFDTEMSGFPTVSELFSEGYVLSSGTYDSSKFKLGVVETTIDFPMEYSRSSIMSTSGIGFVTVPVMKTYMGYIIYNDGSCVYALDSSGNIAAEGIDSLVPVYQRDKSGNPLFKAGNKYYYIIDGTGTLGQVDYNPDFQTNSISYSYLPSDIQSPVKLKRFYVDKEEIRLYSLTDGKDVTDFVNRVIEVKGEEALKDPEEKVPEYEKRVAKTRLWGYTDNSGKVVIPPVYYYASEFNPDGYAFVAAHDGRIKMIDKNEKVILDGFGERVRLQTEDSAAFGVSGFYLPSSFDEGSIGMFRFDHGLMRITRKLYDFYALDNMVIAEDVLIYQNGKIFAITDGYTICGYSDGVILLRRGSRYGYMDYTGRWITGMEFTSAQPFYEGLAVVGYPSGRKAVIDTNGNTVLPAVFDYITNCSGGVMAVYELDRGWAIYNKTELAG